MSWIYENEQATCCDSLTFFKESSYYVLLATDI